MMFAPDEAAIASAKLNKFVHLSNDRKPRPAVRELPKLLMHGTTIANALQNLCDGGLNAGESICGTGVYSLQCPSHEDADLHATFKRLHDDGCNIGAAFLFEPQGILIKAKNSETVPPGATSFGCSGDEASRQYSSHPRLSLIHI